jgi:CelD/BcsL family acetyltransferase involved in cellulose biosynthesis
LHAADRMAHESLHEAAPIETHESAAGLAGEWDELVERTRGLPWLRPGWIDAWWSAFGEGTLRIVAVRDEGRLTGVLPLYERRGALSSTTNWHTPEFGPVTASAEASELMAGVLSLRPRRLSLAWLDKGKPGFAECSRLARDRGYRLIVRTIERSPYIDTQGDWERYEEGLSSKLLRELRRRRRRLESRGELALDVSTGNEGLDELLEQGFRIEAAGWKGERGLAIDSQARTRQFYGEIARWAAARGLLRLAFLRLDGQPFAFDYAIEEHGIHYLLKTGYDPGFRADAPGQLLRYLMIRRAFDEGLTAYEFLGTDEAWKLEWADAVRERWALQAFAPTLAGRIDWAAFALGRPLAKRVLRLLRR